ncbi:replication initiator protein A [Haematobacter massiliensis]|uniref:Plasmid replication initiator RepA n=1 Tax=Haematobacter genomosp. 1 TaxID=366618 RepID=A0A212A793_9RHOB|nr:replication initiator protein A [Haematobacter massiliensis]OWJ75340.1 plasmid replication initiator RepA [Haematobacter genomosp. 1]QBJ22861.1 RepB family plasmid replication initiator protein [Haematobacter massiliensis]
MTAAGSRRRKPPRAEGLPVPKTVPGTAPAASLPAELPRGGFFVADIFDALPKDDLGSMEHPMFSLSTRPDLRILAYAHNGVEITVTPSVRGLATIHDKDILIFCVSQLMAAINAGRPVSRSLRLKAADLMAATGREASGDGYQRLREAFERLAGTRITTNMVTGETETTTGFGMIEAWQIVRHSRGGRMISVSVTLSDWLYRAVLSKSVLTLSRDYFRLRKPLERRVYELARKHCGRQPEWRVSIEVLHKKSGSASPRRVFRKMIRDMIAADTLPDYTLAEEAGDVLRVTPREVVERARTPLGAPQLTPEAIEEARALAPGWDIYALEADWRRYWAATGRPRLASARKAFLGYVRARAAEKG